MSTRRLNPGALHAQASVTAPIARATRARRVAGCIALSAFVCGAQPLSAHGPAPSDAGRADVGAAAPAPVRVTTSVEPKQVTIGTPFRFTIRVEADPGVEVALPVLAERLGDFEMTDFGRRDVATPGGTGAVELWYELRAYETGAQFVPPVAITYRAPGGEPVRIDSPRVVIDVKTVLAKSPEPVRDASPRNGASAESGGAPQDSAETGDAEADDAAAAAPSSSSAASAQLDVPDIEPAVPIREPARLPWLAAAAAAAVALLALGAWLSRRRAISGRAAAPRPAHEVALEALARLRDEHLVEHGELERYYVALSDVVRRYLEARFGVRAPEMTTDEFLAAAQRSRELTAAQRAALAEFLAEADLVKFARMVPTRERAERAWTAAHDFVEATRAREEDGRAAA